MIEFKYEKEEKINIMGMNYEYDKESVNCIG